MLDFGIGPVNAVVDQLGSGGFGHGSCLYLAYGYLVDSVPSRRNKMVFETANSVCVCVVAPVAGRTANWIESGQKAKQEDNKFRHGQSRNNVPNSDSESPADFKHEKRKSQAKPKLRASAWFLPGENQR